MDSLLAVTTNRTLLLITHRLSALERMDEVAVMEDGHIIERGSHADLMNGATRYRQMHAVLALSP